MDGSRCTTASYGESGTTASGSCCGSLFISGPPPNITDLPRCRSAHAASSWRGWEVEPRPPRWPLSNVPWETWGPGPQNVQKKSHAGLEGRYRTTETDANPPERPVNIRRVFD